MKTELNNPRDKIKVVTMNGSLMPLNKAKVSVTAPGLSYAALVLAILNDTTGTLMSCAWKEPKCRIGLILGTGTNACYLENVEKVTTFTPENEEDRYFD